MRYWQAASTLNSGLFASIRPNMAYLPPYGLCVTTRDLPLLARVFFCKLMGQRFYGVKFCRADWTNCSVSALVSGSFGFLSFLLSQDNLQFLPPIRWLFSLRSFLNQDSCRLTRNTPTANTNWPASACSKSAEVRHARFRLWRKRADALLHPAPQFLAHRYLTVKVGSRVSG